MTWLPPAWTDLFRVDTPLLELVARGSILYVAILVLMRCMPRRTGGELATMDLVLLFMIAGAASNALGDSDSVTESVVLIAVLMGWNVLVNAASYRFRWIEGLVSAPPVQVIRNGKMIRRNMRREFLTEEELMGSLREQGIGAIDEVKAAFIESEGALSVVRYRRGWRPAP